MESPTGKLFVWLLVKVLLMVHRLEGVLLLVLYFIIALCAWYVHGKGKALMSKALTFSRFYPDTGPEHTCK